MSHTFQVSDEQYANIVAYTAGRDETPETLFHYWVQGKIDRIKILAPIPREQANRKEKEYEKGPLDLLQIAGMFSIGEPGWADRHDEVFGGEKLP